VRSVRLRLPSPAMAVALLALFVALGGSSYAALKINSRQIADNSVRSRDLRNNDVRSRDVRNNSLTGADVNEARLGTVPSADSANSANTAGSARTAGSASTAANAEALGGVGPDGFVRTPTEPVRLIGTPGNPDFQNGFKNHALGASAGFFKDQFGVVHLQGDLDPPGSANRIFTLPPGYRPDQNGAQGPSFLVTRDGSGTAVVSVEFEGEVELLNSASDHIAINGITFRATH
jgi:hypothetical protein